MVTCYRVFFGYFEICVVIVLIWLFVLLFWALAWWILLLIWWISGGFVHFWYLRCFWVYNFWVLCSETCGTWGWYKTKLVYLCDFEFVFCGCLVIVRITEFWWFWVFWGIWANLLDFGILMFRLVLVEFTYFIWFCGICLILGVCC